MMSTGHSQLLLGSPCGYKLLPEYSDAVQNICIMPSFISSSTMEARLRFISSLPSPASVDDVFIAVVRRAFFQEQQQVKRERNNRG